MSGDDDTRWPSVGPKATRARPSDGSRDAGLTAVSGAAGVSSVAGVTPRAGYCYCTCRDCFEITIGRLGEAFCWECEESGCPDYYGINGLSQECQVEREVEPLVPDGALDHRGRP